MRDVANKLQVTSFLMSSLTLFIVFKILAKYVDFRTSYEKVLRLNLLS